VVRLAGIVFAAPVAVTLVELSPSPIFSTVGLAGFMSAAPAAVTQVESSPAPISCCGVLNQRCRQLP
jgi:hypothetical protein